ncbi:hypothetical protein [Sphaerotilus sp.]|uniref:hypothetical protein n=1 Tax=Sphaerotilus sp. TaxID=2093942 RepID=UPI0025F8F2E1|nr:hypothetical protein [Sphaerotilus sp.]
MRRSLKWGLTASGMLSAVALWTDTSPRIVAAVEPRLTARDSLPLAPERRAIAPQATAPSPPPLPATWTPTRLALAQRDLFAPADARPVAPPTTAAPPPAQPPAPPPPPPTPEMRLRYLGRMQTPQGETLVYLSAGDTALPVKKGDALDNGFVIDSIDDDGIHLLYPPNQQRLVIAIPPARP